MRDYVLGEVIILIKLVLIRNCICTEQTPRDVQKPETALLENL